MRRMREPSEKLHNALYFMSGMMCVILVLVIAVGVKTKAENAGDRKSVTAQTQLSENAQPVVQAGAETGDTQLEKWQEGTVDYKGKKYQYNTSLKVYLMMGIDKNDPVEDITDYTQGGQADAMFLLVVNDQTQEIKVVSINRNTMTDIELCDENGIDLGSLNAQICLQHAFGDGQRLSCSKTVDVVSKLFDNIPIEGYLAMNMGAIPQMNDAVGGVEVTVLQTLSVPKEGVDLRKGDKVTLNGTQAYYYLHGRDTKKKDSATKRLRREEQYIVAYMNKLKKIAKKDPDNLSAIYDSISDYLVASVDFTGMVEQLMNYDFSGEQMYTVPGETTLGDPVDGKQYEEYHVDEDAMQDLVMQVFYTPVH